MMNALPQEQFEVPASLEGKRLDAALAALYPAQSRTVLKQWIEEGHVSLEGTVCRKPREAVRTGDTIALESPAAPLLSLTGQDVAFRVAYEDETLLVVDKPAGLVVHPGAGNPDRTLVNGLLHREPELAALPRAGVIHRLDKDTSGLLLVARTSAAFHALTRQMAARAIHRVYAAIVNGVPVSSGSVDAPVGRDRMHRTRMRITGEGREALTHYRVVKRFRCHAQLELTLETGRTHQIRVHMQHLGHPLLGDPTYMQGRVAPSRMPEALQKRLAGLTRQALHACRLEFEHPESGEMIEVRSPLPSDFRRALTALAADLKALQSEEPRSLA